MARPTKYDPSKNQAVIDLMSEGASIVEVAGLLDVRRETIYDWINKKSPRFSIELYEVIRGHRKKRLNTNKGKFKYTKGVYNQSEYITQKRKIDNSFRLRTNISALLRHHLKSKNRTHTFDLLPYNLEELKAHLESQFDENMNWDNYGKYWHLDHIKPASWFKYSSHTDKDFLQCWSLNNLQPLKAMDNMLKSNFYEG